MHSNLSIYTVNTEEKKEGRTYETPCNTPYQHPPSIYPLISPGWHTLSIYPFPLHSDHHCIHKLVRTRYQRHRNRQRELFSAGAVGGDYNWTVGRSINTPFHILYYHFYQRHHFNALCQYTISTHFINTPCHIIPCRHTLSTHNLVPQHTLSIHHINTL